MSYILDALRKADAQRERDPARGIHAQPVQASPLERPEGHQPRLWLWGAAAIVAGLLAVAAWQLAGPAAPPVAVPAAQKVKVSAVVIGLRRKLYESKFVAQRYATFV